MNTRTTFTAGGLLLALTIGFTTVNSTQADSLSAQESSKKEAPAKPTHDLNAVAYGKTVQSELEARYARYGAIQKKPVAKPAAAPATDKQAATEKPNSKSRWGFGKLFGGIAKNDTPKTKREALKTEKKDAVTNSTPKPKKELLLASAAKSVSSKKTEKKRVPLFSSQNKKPVSQKTGDNKTVKNSTQQTPAAQNKSKGNHAPKFAAADKPNSAVLKELNKLYKQNGGQMPPMQLSSFPKSNQKVEQQQQIRTNSSRVVITKQSENNKTATNTGKSETNPLLSLLSGSKRKTNTNASKQTKKPSTRKPLFSSKKHDQAANIAEPKDPAEQKITSKKKPVQQVAHQESKQSKSTKRPGLLNRLGLFSRKKTDYSNLPPEPVEPPKKIAKQPKAKSIKPTGVVPTSPAAPAPPVAPAPPALAQEEIPLLKKVAEKTIAEKKAESKKPVAAEKPIKSDDTPYTGLTLQEEELKIEKPNVKTVSGNKVSKEEETFYKLPQIRPKNAPAAQNSKQSKLQQIAERKDANGLKGFCPVVLRDERNLVDAKPLFHSKHNGNIYYFSSAIAKLKFDQQPEKYAPAADGNDVVSAKTNAAEIKGSLDHAVWFRDQLFLFSSQANKAAFVAEPGKFLDK